MKKPLTKEADLNRFAFVIHPLDISFIHKHPWFHWTRYFPDNLIEAIGAYVPPIYLSRIVGGRSPATGQRIEGYLFTLGATPRQMMRCREELTYKRLEWAAGMADRRGARIMGLGAYTSVVGDAGISVARKVDIAITNGNSLTVAVTLETIRQALSKMGVTNLSRIKAMVIGASGSIGSTCARLIARDTQHIVLVSLDLDKLEDLKKRIIEETHSVEVIVATKADEKLADCDLIIAATSAMGKRILDITRCKPGAVICDVARPPDIKPAEASLRPDVLVIDSGEVIIPGDVDFGYDIGLPPRLAYGCMAETALLAMEGRFEDYTLGRNIPIEKVEEIYRLFVKHGFQLAGLYSFGKPVTDEALAQKRILAEQ
jgi:predicted amino acid dehydrogenase